VIAAATGPAPRRGLGILDRGTGRFQAGVLDDLQRLLGPGDVLVVNDAATLPAAMHGTTGGVPVELRLARYRGGDRWQVGVLGAGTWRTPTEHRGPPPVLRPGDRIAFAVGSATVVEVADPHLVDLAFDGPWFRAIYAGGEPVRYSYLGSEAPLGAFQTAFAGRPWASESPSAGLPLRWADLLGLRRAGVVLASITHAAGLSSIDGGALDARLPLPERSDIPARTVAVIAEARRRGGRVIAVGTTVVRALEGRVAEAGALVAGESETSLVLGPDTPLRVVDGVLTKLHAPGESHFALLTALVPARHLAAAVAQAAKHGFRSHEFGDTLAILGGTSATVVRREPT
jgi:S-adenosylmethionine:tRNA ribosyltransferase-isomerase